MKYLIICMLFASCSIFKKSVKTQKQDVSKSTLLLKDSSGSMLVEEVKETYLTQLGVSLVDSGYDKVIDELIKDYGDSIITVRTTKEKGQKRTEQLSHTSKYDSAGSMITEHSQLQEIEQEDSTATSITIQKNVSRSSFMPWWVWLIAVVPIVGIVVYNRSSSLKFLRG